MITVITFQPDIPTWALPGGPPGATLADWLNGLLCALGQLAPHLVNTAAHDELGDASLLLYWAYKKLHSSNLPTWPHAPDRPAPHLLAEAAGLLYGLCVAHGFENDDEHPRVCCEIGLLQ